MPSFLDKLSRAEQMLADIATVDQAKEVIQVADLAAEIARRIELGTAAINHAALIKAKAMCRLADIVDAGQASGEFPRPGRPRSGIIREADNYGSGPRAIPVRAPRLAEARKIRDAFGSDDGLEEVFTEATEAGRELSTKRLVAAAAARSRPTPVETPPMPGGTYRTAVVDPPWPMLKIEREERPLQGDVLDYPTMSLEEITKLPVPQILDPGGAHVYLWTTHKFLPDALEIFEAWGVRYQCVMTWVKNVGITPFSWMYDTEHVLFGNYGSGLKLAQLGLRLSFTAPATGHSVKPGVFYERVRAASPGPRLDMFSRRDIDGFEQWGREAACGLR